MLAITISLIAVAFFLFYNYWVSVYKKWKKKGIVSIAGKFPFGSSVDLPLRRRFPGHVIEEMYYKKPREPYFGMYIMRIPWLVVRDPEIIRLVMSKEFSHFRDRQLHQMPENDPISHNLANLTGERWRALRVKLTPTFTSGKLKAMFPLFLSSAEGFHNLLMSKMNSEVSIKEFTARFTTDIICSCAFGLETNTLANPEHDIRNLIKFFGKNRWLSFIKELAVKTFPQLESQRRRIPIEIERFLIKMVRDTVEYREKNGVKRNDFMDLLIELKNKGTVGEETKEDIKEPFEMTVAMMAAQSFVFLFAGFETSSSVQSYCLYELALNQDIQKRLREEIDKVIEKHGELSYQAVQDMTYLHMVISETMRKYPTVPTLARVCTKPFTLPAGHHLDRGDHIMIPVWALHHDAQYYPEPDKFNPERFSPENEGSIKPFTYMPFGEGPRICIGNRFGLLQTKMGIITVIKSLQDHPCEKTTIPIQMANSGEISASKTPIILKLTSRNNAL